MTFFFYRERVYIYSTFSAEACPSFFCSQQAAVCMPSARSYPVYLPAQPVAVSLLIAMGQCQALQ